MASFLQKVAVYAAAILGTATAAQAQTIYAPPPAGTPNIWNMPPAHTQSTHFPPAPIATPAPAPQQRPSLEDVCRDFAANYKPQTIYPKIGKAYLEARDGFACELTRSPSGQNWNISDTYNTQTKQGVEKLSRDNQASAREEARLIRTERSRDDAHQRKEEYRTRHTTDPERRQRGEPHRVTSSSHLIGNPGPRIARPERRDLPEDVKPDSERRHNAPIATPGAP